MSLRFEKNIPNVNPKLVALRQSRQIQWIKNYSILLVSLKFNMLNMSMSERVKIKMKKCKNYLENDFVNHTKVQV